MSNVTIPISHYDALQAKIAELEKELSSIVAGLFSENELAILKLEQQAKGISDFVSSIEGFSEGYIQALKEQDND
jgi:hypothetical protein